MSDQPKNVCATCGREPAAGETVCPNDGNSLFIPLGSSTRDPLIGQQVGDYEVVELIGEGGMGLVYKGIHATIKKRVAIKVLRPEFASDPAQVKRLVSEAEAVNSISNRNIIDIFGLGQLPDGRHYIIMEFLEGEGLDVTLAARAPLPVLEVVELMIDICGPLFAAHRAGVIHRDLKPSNVFVVRQPDGTRYLKLLDFGLAKKALLDGRTSQTSMTQISGTPDYMAPEQARAQPISTHTDLYALGVMGWQMLTGRLPFVGASPMDVMMAHVSNAAGPPSAFARGVPAELDALVLWLMEKTPEARPGSAEQVRGVLKQLGQKLRDGDAGPPTRKWTGELPPYGPGAKPAPRARSRRGALLLAAAAVAVGAVATTTWLRGDRTPAALVPPPPPRLAAVAADAGTPPAPAPPPVIAASTEPVALEGPAPLKAPRPRDNPPTVAELKRRLAALEKLLKARPEPDPSARQYLDKQRLRLSLKLSPPERRDVAKRLDNWERTFLKR